MRSLYVIRRLAAASFAALVLLGLTTQASVADSPGPTGSVVATRSDGVAVRLAAGADSATAEAAASNPQAVAAASTVCGGSYNTLAYIDASLPGDTGAVSGSMAAYVGGGYLCIVFYNQTPGGANWMYLQACPGTTSSSACGYDSGTFSSYRKPCVHNDRLRWLLHRGVSAGDRGRNRLSRQRQGKLQLLAPAALT